MSKELADRLESYYALDMIKDGPMKDDLREAIAALRSEPVEYVLVGHTYKLPNNGMSSSRLNMTGHNMPDDTPLYAEPSRESRAEPVAGQLSAEQVEAKFDANDAPSPKYVEHIRFEGRDCVVLSPEGYEYLYSTALSSLRGTFADGIEAAAKLCDELAELPGNSYETIQTKLCAKSIRAYGKSIRALAQGQRTSEQEAAELLREALDAYDHIVVKTGYQGDFDTSAGRAHLARKEQ